MSPRPAPDLAARRESVLRSARRLAESEGWSAVTVRRLATELAVTQPVLYTVFRSRQAVVDAVAVEGFDELAGAIERATAGRSGTARLAGLVTTYLGYARQHPATYDAMFTLESGLRFAARDSPPALLAAFGTVQRSVGSEDPVRAEVAWSLLHGLVALERSGRLPARAQKQRREEVLRLLQSSVADPAG